MYKKVSTPLREETLKDLKAGDSVLISGKIFSARDAAHKRMVEALERGEKLPFDVAGQIIYYAGPCPPKPGYAAGPFGPTTSGRMDKYAPEIIQQGLTGMMGKGDRAESVIDAMIKHNCIYFAAIGGLGAYTSTVIKSLKVIAYEDLGAEAVMELWVEDFPAIVAIDT
ncbi:MAG: hydro-lyase family enzyme Fe-S type, tartrate/fumarate subfamily, partial [Clostridia bacterium]|nr:hydro-lyase family enzyme Fe-S type, tartrate/fumarate subfamily [Clostridia bacterium]